MDELAKKVKKIHGNMKGKRSNWDSHWQEVTDYVLPRKNDVTTGRDKVGGEKKTYRVYDSTAIQAVEILASALQGMLTNPATQWFDLTTGIPEIDSLAHVRAWLQKAARRIVQVLNNSNFQTEIHEVYTDIGSIGTAALRMEDDDKTFVRFKASPIYEHYIKENHKGLIDCVSRELKMDGRQINQRWNLKKVKERLDPMERYKVDKIDEDRMKEWNMLHFVSPREDLDEELLPKKGRKFKFVSIYVIEDLDIVMDVGGFEEFPYAIPRWTKTSGEVYGRSPAIKSLADIKMINQMMKTTIRAAQKIVDPPLQAPDDGILLPIKANPGGLNYYRAGTADRIVPLDTGGRIDISQQIMEDVRRRIREAFFIDQLQLVEGPQMTATEVLQRTEEKLRMLGPVLGRLHFELLTPLIDRVFGILARKGELPEDPPEELADLDLEVQFSSMIARAQRGIEADNIQRVMGIVAPMVDRMPEIMDNIDGDGLLKYLGNVFNVPQEMFRPEKDVEEQREAQAQQQQQQVALEQQNLQSQTANNMGMTAQ